MLTSRTTVSSLREARALIATMRAKAFARHVVIPEPPEEPLPENCCERGCDHCVYTVYYQALAAWQRDIEQSWP
jgi:Oxidoreductase-like protein, N-terminal